MIDHSVLHGPAGRQVPASALRKSVWWLLVVAVLGVIAAAVYHHRPQPSEGKLSPPGPASETRSTPKATAEPTIRYPIAEAQTKLGHVEPLPAFDKSDQVLQGLLASLLDQDSFGRLLHTSDIVHRFVVTIDNLPRRKLPHRLLPVKPLDGQFLTGAGNPDAVIAAENFKRYEPYIFAAEALDAEKLVEVYVRFYPWFQQEYRALGYPSGAFNDRLIEAIDDLLLTPEIDGPIRVTQSKVLYEFADADLEALSAGKKILLRMGRDNAARIKARLEGIRRELTGTNVGDQGR